jgi:hypothetical protein
MESLYESLRQQRLIDALDTIKSGVFRHLKEPRRLESALAILDQFRLVSVL